MFVPNTVETIKGSRGVSLSARNDRSRANFGKRGTRVTRRKVVAS